MKNSNEVVEALSKLLAEKKPEVINKTASVKSVPEVVRVIGNLSKLASKLDLLGATKAADLIDSAIKSIAYDEFQSMYEERDFPFVGDDMETESLPFVDGEPKEKDEWEDEFKFSEEDLELTRDEYFPKPIEDELEGMQSDYDLDESAPVSFDEDFFSKQ